MKQRKGTTSVEFAFALSILLAMVMGGIELVRLTMLQHTADHSAYLAARKAIVPGASVAAVRERALNHLNVIGVHNGEVLITPDTITDDTAQVNVLVTIPSIGNSWVLPKFRTAPIVGRCLMATERSPMQMYATLSTNDDNPPDDNPPDDNPPDDDPPDDDPPDDDTAPIDPPRQSIPML